MTISSATELKNVLLSSIDFLLDHREEYLYHPETAFTRTKKISFEKTILFPMIAGAGNLATELIDFFDEGSLPLPSAMIQRRNQVRSEAFRTLFAEFTGKLPVQKTYLGYQLIACDGSRLNLPYNYSDKDTFSKNIEKRKGMNQIHLNCLYDILNDRFLEASLHSVHKMNEKSAFCEFLGSQPARDPGQKKIFIADRGYPSYNVLAHVVHNGQLCVLRASRKFIKDLCRNALPLDDEPSFDKVLTFHFGRHQSKKYNQYENYHYLKPKTRYDFLERGSDDVDRLQLRILKFPISEDSFEYIVTTLPAKAFSLDKIKELYNLRWNIETAYRHLKYAGNMVHIHSLKKEFLIQEIYGKLTLYNFAAALMAINESVQKKTDKYTYVLNHTQVQRICIRFLRGSIQKVEEMIARFLVPVRPGRKFKRNLRRQSADTLLYR